MAKRSEETEILGFVDVAGFAGVEDGQAIVKPLEVSVNKDMAGLPTKYSQRIHGERIEIHKRTLPAQTNSQMSAVQKHFKEIQKPFEQTVGKMGIPSKKYEPNNEDYEPSDGKQDLSPLGVLKNMVDNHASDLRRLSSWVKTNMFLAGIGVAGFILAIVMLVR